MTQIQLRRGTAAQWTSANSVLAAGEPGVETDTGKFKIGDGSTQWTSLSYATDASRLPSSVASASLDPTTGQYVLSSSQGSLVAPSGDDGSRAAALAPLVARLVAGDALNLGISSSSSFYGANLPAAQGTGEQCWSQVMAKYGNTSSTIINCGMGGAITDSLLTGGNATNGGVVMPASESACKTHSFDAVIVQINHNDAGNITAALYQQNMLQVYQACRRAGAIVIVVPPLGYGPYWTESWAQGYHKAVYRAAADGGAILFPIEEALALPDHSGPNLTLLQSDQIHPTAGGAADYGAAFAALWPNRLSVGHLLGGVGASIQTPREKGTYLSPKIEGQFYRWRTSKGAVMETTRSTQYSENDGHPPLATLQVPTNLLLRNTLFAFDGRVSQTSSATPLEVSGEYTVGPPTMGIDGTGTNNAPTLIDGGGYRFAANASPTAQCLRVPVGSDARLLPATSIALTCRVLIQNVSSNGEGSAMMLLSRAQSAADVSPGFMLIDNGSHTPPFQLAANYGSVYAGGQGGAVAKSTSYLLTFTKARDDKAIYMYINGVVQAFTGTIGTDTNTYDWCIGARWNNTGMTSLDCGFCGDLHWVNLADCYVDPAEEANFYTNIAKPYFNAIGRSIALP